MTFKAPPLVPLVEVCTRISSGGTPSRQHSDYFTDSGNPWVKSQELRDVVIRQTEEQISDAGLANSSAKYYPIQTVLIAMYGATVGQLGILGIPATVNQAICGLCVDLRRADPRYVFYALMATRRELISQAAGAAQQNLNQDVIRKFRIPLPALPVQRKIAVLLSAYDDLIENHQRRINVVEEMARRIYQEWFVDFRYPGHGETPCVDSELGPIPGDWDLVRLGDWARVVVGSTPSRQHPEFWSGGTIAWINSSQINDLCVVHPTEMISAEGFAASSTKMMPVGTTLVAITGATLGQVSYLAIEACGSQNVCGLYFDSTPGCQSYLYFTVRACIGRIASRAMGGAQQHINRGIVQETLVLRPGVDIQSKFDDVVGGCLSEIVSLLRQQDLLRETRDLVLSRLVSGEIDAESLDIPIEEPAA